jgi:hypothetical protein
MGHCVQLILDGKFVIKRKKTVGSSLLKFAARGTDQLSRGIRNHAVYQTKLSWTIFQK